MCLTLNLQNETQGFLIYIALCCLMLQSEQETGGSKGSIFEGAQKSLRGPKRFVKWENAGEKRIRENKKERRKGRKKGQGE